MTETVLDRAVIFLLRVFVGWLFLYAGSWQVLQNYSAGGFLNHVVTFHSFFALFATTDQRESAASVSVIKSASDRPLCRIS